MDYIKLTDGTQVTIEDGASLDRIIHIAATDCQFQCCRDCTVCKEYIKGVNHG